MSSPTSHAFLELDFWIPSLRLAFEYQVLIFTSYYFLFYFTLFIVLFCFNIVYRIRIIMCQHGIVMLHQRFGKAGIVSVVFPLLYLFSFFPPLFFSFPFLLLFDNCIYNKAAHLAARGDTFVSVPCWWDGSHERFSPILLSFSASLCSRSALSPLPSLSLRSPSALPPPSLRPFLSHLMLFLIYFL